MMLRTFVFVLFKFILFTSCGVDVGEHFGTLDVKPLLCFY